MGDKSKTSDKVDETPPLEPVEAVVEFGMLSVDLIDDPEAPMRSDMTPASVEDLVMSIKQVGIIEPLVVKAVNGRYEVIAGHRRLFSSRLAKLVEVPCYIRKANSEQTEMLKIHENLYRADIKPSDEAKHFQYLLEKQKMSPVKIAQLISKSPSYVADRLAILNYPDFLKEAMDSGEISFSVAREFARFDDLQQMSSAVYYAKRGGMTQEMARKWVQDYKRAQEQPALQENIVINEATGAQEIEHTTECIYCSEKDSLMNLEVAYIHTPCRQAATAPAAPVQSTS